LLCWPSRPWRRCLVLSRKPERATAAPRCPPASVTHRYISRRPGSHGTSNTQRETATVIQGGTLSRLYSAGPLVRQEQQPQHDGERRAHAEIHVLDPGAARVKPGKRDPDGEQHQEGAGAAREPGRRAE